MQSVPPTRQAELYSLLVESYDSSKIIAFKMGLSESTIRLYNILIFRKFKVSGRIELIIKHYVQKQSTH